MIITLILSIIIAVGIYLCKYNAFNLLGIILASIFGLFLVLHLSFWSQASYNYNILSVQRDTFVQTLEDARKNGYEYETATIAKDILSWNITLAEYKYNNSTLLLSDYVDDRIETLEPIK